ncbi:MAG: GTPase [candidate division WOR-3 bacterium]|nr:50S ribosome-binding GTPase [Candidatus Omnitrophota bacterium]
MIDKDVYKKNFYNFIQNTISLLEEIKSFPEVKKEEFLNSAIQNIFLIIDKKIKEMKWIVNNLDWDYLNIAFLGETNAGKSTLIEALSRGNGSSIGEGYKDYTQELIVIPFDKKIKFLDMPGIEGKEKALDEIKKGLRKSHIVFLIIGNNKEPEEGTVKKIKEYIKDKPKLYVILNVRGKPTKYMEKTSLIENENYQKIIKRTIDKFKDICVEDAIILNAYLAFLSVGKPKRKEFRKDKKKITEAFSEKRLSIIEKIRNFLIGPSKKILERAYLHSNLKNLEELLQKLSADNDKDIFISNTYKFLDLLENTISQLENENKKFINQVVILEKEMLKNCERIEKVVKKYLKEIKKNIEIEIDNLEIKVRECVYVGIDEEEEEEEIKKRVRNVIKYKEKQTNEKIKKLNQNMKEEIKNIFSEWKGRIKLEFEIAGFEFESISEIIDESILELLSEILKMFSSTFTGSAIGGIIGAVVIGGETAGIIGAAVGFLAGLIKYFLVDEEEAERKKKQKAYYVIKKEFNKVREIFFQQYKKNYNKMPEEIKMQIKKRFPFEVLKNFSFLINENIEKLNSIKDEIATYLCKYLFSDKIEKAIINLHKNQCIIVGNYSPPKDLERILRLKQIMCYNSIKEFSKSKEN